MLVAGCGSENASQLQGSPSYSSAGPLSSLQFPRAQQELQTPVGLGLVEVPANLIIPRIATYPVSLSYSAPSYSKSAFILSDFGSIYYRGFSSVHYTEGDSPSQLTPPVPSSIELNASGSYTFSTDTYIYAPADDDGVTMTFGPATFSGIPSGSDVTVSIDGAGTKDYRKLPYSAPDGTVVTESFTDEPYGNGRLFSRLRRFLTLTFPQTGVYITNATASSFGGSSGPTLDFDIVPLGQPLPTVNQWTVSIVQANNTTNQPFYSFPVSTDTRGPGTAAPISSGGLHVNLPWNGKNEQNQSVSGDFSWVMATNVTSQVSSPGGAGTATLKLDQTQRSLKILAPSAPSLNPSGGGNSTLVFGLTADGLGSNPSFTWNVTIESTDTGSVLYRFPVAQGAKGPGLVSNNTGTTLRVELPWDGRDISNNPVTSNFTWVIDAEASQNGSNNQTAQARVPNSTAVLSVFNPDRPLVELAVSGDRDLLFEEQNSAAKALAKARLGSVYPAGGRLQSGGDASNIWRLKASGLQFSGSAPTTVTVTLQGDFSKKPLEATLVNQDPTRNSTWEGDFDFKSRGLLLPQDQLTGHPRDSYKLASYTLSAAEDVDSLTSLKNLLKSFPNLDIYPTPRINLGNLCDPPEFARTFDDDLAETLPENVRCFGFEAVQFKLDSAKNPGIITPLKATLKVRNPSSLAVMTVHGGHDGALLLGGGNLIPELDLRPQDCESLKTLMLTSCNALDMHDYNNNYTLEFPRTGPLDPVSLRTSPGQKWWKATGNGKSVLLGYNFPILNTTGQAARASYLNTTLKNLEQRSVPATERQQLAWLRANYEVAMSLNEASALNACAWDQNYYYFISFDPPYSKLEKGNTPVRTVYGFYRIRLDSNGDNTSVDPSSVPPSGGGAEKLAIPGVNL